MSLEQALLTHAEALNNHAAALREAAGATPKVDNKVEVTKTDTAAEKKPAEKPAAKKAAEKPATKKAAEKPAEITDEAITGVFGPLLAKSLDADTLASNKEFVATINEHFGVAKLRDLDQEQRAKAMEWGKARAEDDTFEIPGSEEDDDSAI